jgi:hypothetical protein
MIDRVVTAVEVFGKLFAVTRVNTPQRGYPMLDFIIAGALLIILMFILFFCISFVTVGIAYAVGIFIRRCLSGFRSPDLRRSPILP